MLNDELSWLEGGLGVAISLYGATAFMLFTARQHYEQKHEDKMAKLDARIDKAVEHAAEENDRLWEQVNQHHASNVEFQKTILRDMREMPTRSDLAAAETRITVAVQNITAAHTPRKE